MLRMVVWIGLARFDLRMQTLDLVEEILILFYQ